MGSSPSFSRATMIRPNQSRFITTSLLLLLFFSFHLLHPSGPKDAETIKQKLDAVNRKISEIEKQKGSILNQIYKIELKYEKELLNKNRLEMEIRELSKNINQKKAEENRLITRIDNTKEKIRKILRVLYKQGSNKHIRVFLNTKNINRLFRNYKFFEALISYNNQEIVSFRTDIKNLLAIRTELTIRNIEKQKAKTDISKKIARLRQIKRNKIGLIKKINNDKATYTKLKAELEQEFSKFNDSVIKKIRKKVMISELEITSMKGKFRWPIPGRIISSFGKQRSTRFNTYVMNTGIEIKPTRTNQKIKAIYEGDVVFADYWKGYGKLIVIQHSKHFLSFYGHCDSFLKKNGDSVLQGESIAMVGDTGSAKTKSLYFEIRKNLVAQNPISWLRKRKK